jgi:hypothetical protein
MLPTFAAFRLVLVASGPATDKALGSKECCRIVDNRPRRPSAECKAISRCSSCSNASGRLCCSSTHLHSTKPLASSNKVACDKAAHGRSSSVTERRGGATQCFFIVCHNASSPGELIPEPSAGCRRLTLAAESGRDKICGRLLGHSDRLPLWTSTSVASTGCVPS